MIEAEKAYQYFVIAVPENEEQAKAYFWARKALQSTLTQPNEWVSVEECKPKRGELIVYADNTAWGFQYGVRRVHGAETNFTHWMLLPAPPYRRPPEGEEEP